MLLSQPFFQPLDRIVAGDELRILDQLLVPSLDAAIAFPQVDDVAVRNSLYVLRAVDKRANLLGVSSVLEFAALDKYTFTRDAYLQMRAQQAGQVRPRKKQADDDTDAGRLPPEED